QGVLEPLPHLLHGVFGELLPIQVSLLLELLREFIAKIRVERFSLRRVIREEGVRLDVEGEVLRCALEPQDGVPLRRWEVVGRVHLRSDEHTTDLKSRVDVDYCLWLEKTI